MDGWLGFNGILNMHVSAISCLDDGKDSSNKNSFTRCLNKTRRVAAVTTEEVGSIYSDLHGVVENLMFVLADSQHVLEQVE